MSNVKKKNDDVLVAVILVNYNGTDDTLRCIESLNKTRLNIKVIVVDNASHSKKELKQLSLSNEIEMLEQEQNLGFGRANNIGIKWAIDNLPCTHIFVLNNDTEVEENTLEVLLESFKYSENVGIVAPKILLSENHDFLWYGGAFVNWYKGSLSIPGYGYQNNKLTTQSKVDCASGCAMLFTRESIKDIGGFDPRFFMYEEDFELCLRAIGRGWEIVYNPDSIVFHVGQGTQRRAGEKFHTLYDPRNPRLEFLLFHITKNKLLTISKHAKKSQLVKFSIGYPLFLFYKIVKFVVFRRWDAIKSIFSGIRAYFVARKIPFNEVEF